MPKQETGITDTGEQANPLNRKVRRVAFSWQNAPGAKMGDGTFGSDGTRKGLNRIGMTAKRRGSR